MKLTVLIGLLFFSCSVLAQKHFVGLKSGLGFTEVQQKYYNADVVPKLSTSIGLTYLYRDKQRLSFSVEIIRNTKRFERTYFRSEIFALIIEDITVKYISMPIKAGYTIIEKSKLDCNLGLVLAYSYGVRHTFESTIDIPVQPKAGDLGQEYALLGDLGVNVISFVNSEVYTILSFQKSIGDIFDFSPRSPFPRKIFTYDLSVGYRIKI